LLTLKLKIGPLKMKLVQITQKLKLSHNHFSFDELGLAPNK